MSIGKSKSPPPQLYDRIREILETTRTNVARWVNTAQVVASRIPHAPRAIFGDDSQHPGVRTRFSTQREENPGRPAHSVASCHPGPIMARAS